MEFFMPSVKSQILYRVRQKIVPWSFLLFFQQPLSILIWNFTDLFLELFYG